MQRFTKDILILQTKNQMITTKKYYRQYLQIDTRMVPVGFKLQNVLNVIRQHYATMPDVRNVLLYLHRGIARKSLHRKAGGNFIVVPIDYS